MQTSGLERNYDNHTGNDSRLGCRLDAAFNLLFYVGPIVAGVTLMDHIEDLIKFGAVGAVVFTHMPAQVEGAAGTLM